MKLSMGFTNFLRKRITLRYEVSTAVRENHFTEPRRNATQLALKWNTNVI